MGRFAMAPVFNEGEFAHQLLPKDGVVDSFVVTKAGTNEVTDLISFYHLRPPS
jgi:glycylpeptide N-tetradecanoyltransferase